MMARVEMAVVSEPAKMLEVAMEVRAWASKAVGWEVWVARRLERMSLRSEPRSLRAAISLAAVERRLPWRAAMPRWEPM